MKAYVLNQQVTMDRIGKTDIQRLVISFSKDDIFNEFLEHTLTVTRQGHHLESTAEHFAKFQTELGSVIEIWISEHNLSDELL